MVLSKEDIHRNRAISAIITFLIFGSILLFLILKNISSQNPPFPNGCEQSYLGLIGMSVSGSKESNSGEAVKIRSEEIITGNVNGEIINVKNNKVETSKTETEKLIAEFERSHKKNKNKIQGNNTENNSNEANGTAVTGTKTGTENVTIPGSHTSKNIGIYMERRTVVSPPKLLSDTKEEGKVVVDIVVDSKGIVIEANPNGRGTTTSSSNLKQKAKQAALETKFSANEKLDEQRGTITIVFAFE